MMTENKQDNMNYETTDANVGSIVKLGIILLVVVIVTMILTFGLYHFFKSSVESKEKKTTFVVRPYPKPSSLQLEVHPHEELKIVRAEEEKKLNTYGWVEKEKGIVRIPVKEAFKRVLQEGLPQAKEKKTS